MAKTRAALFSVNAAGKLGKTLVYQGRRFFRHVHYKKDPTNRNTVAQQRAREIFRNGVAKWHTLSDAEKRTYDALSHDFGNIPGFNVFMSLYLNKAKLHAKFGWTKFSLAKFGGPDTI